MSFSSSKLALFIFSVGLATQALGWDRGQAIRVELRSGQPVEGAFVEQSATALVLETNAGRVTIALDEVWNISAPSVGPASARSEEHLEPQEDPAAFERRLHFIGAATASAGSLGSRYSMSGFSRCTPCVNELSAVGFGLALTMGVLIPAGERLRVRLAGTLGGGLSSGPSLSGVLSAELFVAFSQLFWMGVGARFGYQFSNDYRIYHETSSPLFGAVVTPLSVRINSRNRLALTLSADVASLFWSSTRRLTIEFGAPTYRNKVIELSAGELSLMKTDVQGGLLYEHQF